MKKLLVILLLVLYSASSIGATVSMHYCMNKFASWSLSSEKKDKCAKCGMSNTGCCKDEKKQIKLTLDQQKVEFNHVKLSQPLLVQPRSLCNQTACDIHENKQNLTCFHAPPLLLKEHLPSTLSIFLI